MTTTETKIRSIDGILKDIERKRNDLKLITGLFAGIDPAWNRERRSEIIREINALALELHLSTLKQIA